ncbi:MAG: DUF6132 family protein [Bacteroides sp.]|jgi:hypothetical protein|nr:DUF6132 family protein [Bacteroides sp.]MCI1682926.1 DUF6132 family protein [Bacteroides sp.]
MNQWIKQHALTIIGIVIGGLGGFLYWKFVGCQSGTCPITSSPINSTLWGMVLGGLLFNTFEKKKEK